MKEFVQDVKISLRSLTKTAGFSTVAILTLGLGIGVNSAMFTIVQAVVLRSLPFTNAERLVRITGDFRGMGATDIGVSPPELFDYRDRAELFDEVAGVYPLDANLTEVDQPERVEVLLVSPSYFSALETRPALGRVFGAEDNHPGIAEVLVISDGLWKRRFGSAPDAIGRRLRIDDDWYTVVGVMPPAFRHPGKSLRTEVDAWAPSGFSSTPFQPPARGAYILAGAIARVRTGITLDEAQQRLTAFGARLRAEYPNDYTARGDWTPRLIPLKQDIVGSTRSMLLFLFGAVSFVLLIACTNVAGLLLARGSTRQRELAVRRALGAGRLRLARLLLAESLTLSLAGGVLGLLLAFWGVDVLVSLVPERLPRVAEISLDWSVVAFTFGAAILVGIVFGLVPAAQFSNPDVLQGLKDTRSSASMSRRRFRSALVVGEFALAMVLLVGAGLLVRSFWYLQQVDTGVIGRGVLTARVWLPQPNNPATGRYFTHEARLARFEDILQRMRVLPGVESAAAALSLPLDGGRGLTTITIDGREQSDSTATAVQTTLASRDYFTTLGIPILRGRVFQDEDGPHSQRVIVINAEMARRFFGDADPVGKRVHFGGPSAKSPWMTIVGVVGNVLNDTLDRPPQPTLIRPVTQASGLSMGFVVRTSGDPAVLKEGLARAVRESDPDLPVFAVRTMDEIEASAAASRRFTMRLLGGFALLALVLAAIGIYGVMSYLVTQRTREIGIRMALGARPHEVTGLVVVHALKLASIGVAIGAAAALSAAPIIDSMLFRISPSDPLTFVLIGVSLAVTALTAATLPARRAASVEPTIALRAE
jgi:putative ABC transport system permease protein